MATPAEGSLVPLTGYGLIRLFTIVTPDGDSEWWATNDLPMCPLTRVRFASYAWSIEHYHRGLKQFCGVARAQVRAARAQHNHIGLALRALLRLESHCYHSGISWFEAKHAIIRDAWREPKLFIVYEVNSEGKLEKPFAPLIDGSLHGPDALFQLLQGYLRSLAIETADQVVFVADGAHWIWNRVPGLIKALGLNPKQIHEVIDFYLAVEHLGKVAALRTGESAKQRKAWVRRHRRLLLKGQSEQVVEAVRARCRGRHSKAITTERNYFVRNQHRIAYPKLKALQLPIGSGAVESAVRRVVNLRLKGPGIFWHRENAEKMLMLRAYYKAGRWNLLKRMANSHLSLLTT